MFTLSFQQTIHEGFSSSRFSEIKAFHLGSKESSPFDQLQMQNNSYPPQGFVGSRHCHKTEKFTRSRKFLNTIQYYRANLLAWISAVPIWSLTFRLERVRLPTHSMKFRLINTAVITRVTNLLD